MTRSNHLEMKYGKRRYKQGNLVEDCVIHPVPTVMLDDDVDKELDEEIDEVYSRLLGLREGKDANLLTLATKVTSLIDLHKDMIKELEDIYEDLDELWRRPTL